ncbi:L10-interacting MYB domain-containing protein-like protein [Tanacetum coccineum]
MDLNLTKNATAITELATFFNVRRTHPNPVVHVIGIEKMKRQTYKLLLSSDGVYFHDAYVDSTLKRSKQLQKGSVVRLAEYLRASVDNTTNIKEDGITTPEKDTTKDASMTTEKYKDDQIGACFERLEKLGWENADTALFLFVESAEYGKLFFWIRDHPRQNIEYRKLWLLLNPESCGECVKNAGKKFGLLDSFIEKV